MQYCNITYKSNNNIVYSCKYHVVWCPKYRRKVLTNGVDVRLKELLLLYAAKLSVDILEMEIMSDQVHLLMEVDPQFGIHKTVKSIKGYIRFYRWRRAIGRNQTVYREPENITKAKEPVRLMQKGIKFRIYPNREQKNVIHQTLGCCRFIYNKGLAIRNDAYENGSRIGYSQTCAMNKIYSSPLG